MCVCVCVCVCVYVCKNDICILHTGVAQDSEFAKARISRVQATRDLQAPKGRRPQVLYHSTPPGFFFIIIFFL